MCNCIGVLATKGLADWKSLADISANLSPVQAEPGVYVLREVGRGHPYGDELQQGYVAEVMQLYEHKKHLFGKFGLKYIPHHDRDFIERRLERLGRIGDASEGDCLILYIGGSNNLRERLADLLCHEDRHTIEHPVRALLLYGWRIELACKLTPDYPEEEEQLKTVFGNQHSGALPPLNDR